MADFSIFGSRTLKFMHRFYLFMEISQKSFCKNLKTSLFRFYYLSLFALLLLLSTTKSFAQPVLSASFSNYNGYNISCNGLSDGQIDLTITGSGPFNIQWSNGATTEDISGITAGSYTVTVVDVANDTTIETYSLTEPDAITRSAVSIQDVTCFGLNNGSINISVDGGVPNYSFQWSNGSGTEDISGLIAGVYTLTITDLNNCTAVFANDTVHEPDEIKVTATVTNTSCGLINGMIDASISGGISPYGYLWSNSNTTEDLNILASGVYTLTVTDQNLCTKVDSFIVGASTQPVVVLDSAFNVTCFGQSTGRIYVHVNSANGPINYLWSNASVSQNLLNIPLGNYTVTITDSTGCQSSLSHTITEPTDIAVTLTPHNATCAQSNGWISSAVTGGTSPYTYLWSNGASTSSITGLLPGNYTVTVTDAALCTKTASQNITTISGPVVTVDSVKNARCFGQANGAVYISVSGNNGPVTYLWSNAAITQDIVNIVAGTYTVTVTDSSGCTATKTQAITQPIDIAVTLTPHNATCAQSNGWISSAVTGGTSPYTYLWSNGASTSSITGLLPGNYTVTVTDAALCTKTASQNISTISGPVVTVDSVKNARCFGQANGAVYISISGNNGPVTYLWSNAAITQDIVNIVAGTYTVTVTDSTGCVGNKTQVVSQPTNIAVTLTPHNATCAQSNGWISSAVIGGTSPYTYLWSNGASTSSITGLLPGNYTVTVTDAALCTKTASQNITTISGPVVTVDSVKNARCFGQANGAVYISVSGNNGPVTYLWSNAAITQDIVNVVAGTYTVTVTDSSGCTATKTQVVSQPTDIAVTLTPHNATCAQSNGWISSAVTGGTSPYTYLWSNGASTSSITGLLPGNYTVTVTDAALCTKTASQNITTISGPVVTVDSVKNARCFGQANGAVYISVSGNNGPVTYLWSNAAITQDIVNVVAGTYTVTVTDSTGCVGNKTQAITQPTNIAVTLTPHNATCAQSNGWISSAVSGGTSPYTYLWSNGASTSSITGLLPGNYTVTVTDAALCTKTASQNITTISGPVVTVDSVKNVRCFGQANGAVYISVSGNNGPVTYLWSNAAITQDIVNVVAGTYTVTVTDSTGCVGNKTQVVSQPTNIVVTLTPHNATCAQSNGWISSAVTGGTSPYTYLWSNGASTSSITGLLPGNYTVTVTDAALCTKTASQNITTISGPVVTVDSVKNARCFGQANGAVYISVSGNNGPVTYLWSNAAITQDIVNVVAGTYTVTVTDSTGCVGNKTQVVSQPTDIAVTLTPHNATCAQSNGWISSAVTGGTSPYTYLWSNGASTSSITGLLPGNYTVTVTDAALCTKTASQNISTISGPVVTVDSVKNARCFGQANGAVYISVSGNNGPVIYLWSNAAITQDIVNIVAGTYTVTVTDSTGCVGNKTQIITQPSALTLIDTIVPARCGNANGSAGVNVTGGTSPYTYLWNTGQSTASISGLNGGSYTVTVTDSKLCTANRTLIVSNTPSLVISIDTIIHVKCSGQNTGAIKVNVTGGSGPLTYTWTPTQIGTDSIFSLAAGTYKLVVRDTANCRDSINVTINSPSAINSAIYSLPETCGINNGKAWVTVSGGTPGYTFLWNNSSTNDTISNLTKGTYSVTIKDANNCSVNKNILVDSLGGPAITDSIIHVKCFGENTGAIYTTVHGANGPVSYLWSPGGQITQNITGLTAGTYTVTVTDTNSCSSTKSFIISQPTSLNISFTSVTEKCNQANGSAIAAVIGGTLPYSYQWNNGNTTNNIINLTTGYYTITITDGNLCTKRDSVFIGNTNGPSISNFSRNLIKCHNDSSGSLTVNVTGGTPFYNYQWSGFPGVNNATLQNIPAGVYTVTVTDANGCSVNATDSLQNPPLMTITHTLSNASCNLNNGIAQINVSGGAAPYTYSWSNGVTGVATLNNLSNIFYTVTITDNIGCIKTDTFTIQRTPATFVQLTSLNNVTCYGLSNGSITITPSGGDGNYTYQWSYNNIQTQNLNNIPAGSYDVTVTDGTGCTYTMPDIQVFQPDTLIAQVITLPTGCTSQTGSASVSQTGGTQPYTYLWSTGGTTQTINGLSSQIVTVTVTDNNGCTTTTSGIINALSAPVINISGIQNINCFGGGNGFINTTVTGGNLPYNYLWNNGSTTSNISNLSAGTYTLTVTDSAQCSTIITQTLTENPQIQFGLTLIAGPCNGGTPAIAISAPSGGVSPLNILWSDGSTSTSAQATAGTVMTLTVTDNAGCNRDTTFSMLSTNGPQISSIQTTDIICFGDSSGSATVNITGGTPPISIQWIGTLPVQNTATAINLKAGTYTCIVTDVNGCSAQSVANINHLNTLITPVLAITNASCGNSNGQIVVTATGGSGTYQYKLNNGVYSATNTFTNLAAGSDSVFVKDNNGCEVFVISTISNIQGPVISVIDSANVSCFGSNDGFIILNVTGAAQPITYSWSDGPTTLTRNNLGPGNYTFTAQDANNCISVRNFIITEPTAITISEIIPNKNGIYNITCNTLADGEIQVIANGGVPFTSTTAYNYQWSISGASGANVINLTAGPYTVTVTDSMGCSVTKSFLLTEPPALNAGPDFTQSICGTDTIVLTGNIPTYGFGKWTVRSGGGLIAEPDSITTQITAIANGVNVFAWVVYDNFCSDTALYVINKKEKIIADGGIDQNVCDNFVFLAAVPPPSGTGVWQSINGNSTIQNPSSPATKVENLSPGKNIFVWTITNGSCTASDTVKIAILPPEECYTDVVMPTGFTPNEDGYNDIYVIRGLDNTDNTLTIFNRWGNLVYEKKNYSNDWDGKSNNKQILPDGTYYAILRIPARNLVLKTYIDLRR